MLDGLSLVMISYGVYTYLIIDYMDPMALEVVNRCVTSWLDTGHDYLTMHIQLLRSTCFLQEPNIFKLTKCLIMPG